MTSLNLPIQIAGSVVTVATYADLPPTAQVGVSSLRVTRDNGHLWKNTTTGWVDITAGGGGGGASSQSIFAQDTLTGGAGPGVVALTSFNIAAGTFSSFGETIIISASFVGSGAGPTDVYSLSFLLDDGGSPDEPLGPFLFTGDFQAAVNIILVYNQDTSGLIQATDYIGTDATGAVVFAGANSSTVDPTLALTFSFEIDTPASGLVFQYQENAVFYPTPV